MNDIEDRSAEQLVCDIRELFDELNNRARRLLSREDYERLDRTCLTRVNMAIDYDPEWLGPSEATLLDVAEAIEAAARGNKEV